MRKWITAVLSGVFLSGCVATLPPPLDKEKRILNEATGSYTFPFTDTDESAVVEVRFRRNYEPYGLVSWLADGTMEDLVRGWKVEFQNAYVLVHPDGTVSVDTQFVNFKIKEGELNWRPGYTHKLYKE